MKDIQEITAGDIVAIDAMGCQKDIAAQIVGQGADYLLAVKENQPNLHEDIRRTFTESGQGRKRQTEDSGHGRYEIREYRQCSDLSRLRGLEDEQAAEVQRRIGVTVVSHIGDILPKKRAGRSKATNEITYPHCGKKVPISNKKCPQP